MSPAPRDRGLLVGVMGLEDDARVDFPRLRRERRAKVLAGMERHGLDALMLGGVGNVRYVSGARQLGRAGVLPFAPVVVVVRETGRVHLLSTWDEGVPPEIGRDDLYGLSWNPVNLATSLASIDGLRQAQRVGTDGLTPMFAGLLPQLVTTAELVDAAPVLAAARRIKTPDEITCLDVASALAEAALSALDDALEPGITGVNCWASTTSGSRVSARRWRRGRACASPRRRRGRCDSGIWQRTAPSATGNWLCWLRARCTPDTRPAWPALGWPEALGCKGRRIWRRDAPAVWTRWWRRAVQATPAQISTARGRATGTPNHRSRWRMGSDSVPSHR